MQLRQITTGFPAPFPPVTPAHIAGPKPGLDGAGELKARTRVQPAPLRPGNIGNPETLYAILSKFKIDETSSFKGI